MSFLRSPFGRRLFAAGTLLGAGGFCVAMLVAAELYPGGTWLDPMGLAHEFWGNFWCDLLREAGHNGRINPGRLWARAGMLSLAFGLGAFWGTVSGTLPSSRSASSMLMLGVSSALGMTIVIAFPSDRYPVVHRAAITLTGPLGIAATLIVLSQWSAVAAPPERWLVRIGAFTLMGALINLMQFVRQMWFGAAESIVLSATQKLTTFSLLAWMTLTAALALRSATARDVAELALDPDGGNELRRGAGRRSRESHP